ncbi:MAG TPA: Mov34/MPN/PAD-1 family protein [Isosphaeraceae bacterium]|nr:Mov34/MPN/PAD-1 family protein [Isosphaeraceae bacterium]
MSGDDIIFGEMSVREPERRQRPDCDRRFACVSYEVPGPDDLPVFLDRRAADAIERHALSDTSVELGGILLGKECLDPATGRPFVWITQSLEAKHYANTQASFTYTHDSWEEITRERDQLHPESDIVGWYHTHPSFGIFLSHHDLFIHQHFFSQPLQVAYVVDPINQSRGFFYWREGGLAPTGGFYLTADRGDRIALARLANDLEQLANSEGSGGGALSPRLEAELIKMLARPTNREATSTVEKVQLAASFGLLGTFLGMLGVAVVFWVLQLNNRVHEQGESILALARSVEDVGSRQRLAVDTLLEKAGDDKPAAFVERYAKTAKARDEAQRQLSIQRTINETLGSRAKDLEARTTELEKTCQTLEQYRKDAERIPDLSDRIASLEEVNQQQARKLAEIAPWLESTEGKQALVMQHNLEWYRIWFYVGWSCAGLLSLSLLGAYVYFKPLADDTASAGETSAHRID